MTEGNTRSLTVFFDRMTHLSHSPATPDRIVRHAADAEYAPSPVVRHGQCDSLDSQVSTPVIVLGLGVTGLATVRALSSQGLKVYGVSMSSDDPGRVSRPGRFQNSSLTCAPEVILNLFRTTPFPTLTFATPYDSMSEFLQNSCALTRSRGPVRGY